MESQDKKMKEVLAHSKLELPFSDFEDRMMTRIYRHEAQQKMLRRTQLLGLLFFLLGTVFGMVLNFLISQNLSWFSSSILFQERFFMLSQLLYVVLIVLFSDKLWKLFKLSSNTKK